MNPPQPPRKNHLALVSARNDAWWEFCKARELAESAYARYIAADNEVRANEASRTPNYEQPLVK